MQCSKCHRDAIIFQPYSGLHLCDRHVAADVEAKAKKMIRAQGWLKPGDHIAVFLSGNPGSSALLYFLKQLTARRCDIQVSAITIADGQNAHPDISRAKLIADDLDTELLVVSWLDESDIMTETGTGKDQHSTAPALLPPSRSILPERIAQRHGITKIAWGLCLDDAAGVVLGSIIRGEVDKLVRGSPMKDKLLRICPFISVTAAEVSLYAAFCGYSEEQTILQDQGDMLHNDTIVMLDGYTNNHPATKYALLNLGENMAGSPSGIAGLIHACEWYGKCQQCSRFDGSVASEVNDGAH